jgi:putative endonuclease
MAQHNQTGREGEILAAIYLEQKGYTLLHKNWRHKNWEVDIIASMNNRLHIIEVKTRTSTFFGHPEENMTNAKMQYLINAAEEYMNQNPQWQQLQFDILAITLMNDEVEYFLIEDVYL